jgi:hypothetical protein
MPDIEQRLRDEFALLRQVLNVSGPDPARVFPRRPRWRFLRRHLSASVLTTIGMIGASTGLAVALSGTAPHSAPPTTSVPPTATTTTTTATTTTTTTPNQALPPLNLGALPVPFDYTCSAGLYMLSPADQASGECVPYAYLVGGTASDPNNNAACPVGSSMTMGPVECDNETGIVTPVPLGPNTCSTPGGPCPSSSLPLTSQASVMPWSAIEFPTGKCPAGYYFGETDGNATCVTYDYLPGGTSANPNNTTACPGGSGLKGVRLTGTLCTQDAEPYDIVAPVPAETTDQSGPQLSATSEPRSGALGSTSISATATLTGIGSTQTGSLEFDISEGPYNEGQPSSVESVAVSGPGTYAMPNPYKPDRAGSWYVSVDFGFTSGPGSGLEVSGMPSPNNYVPDSDLATTITLP